jgi:hypothetical protein
LKCRGRYRGNAGRFGGQRRAVVSAVVHRQVAGIGRGMNVHFYEAFAEEVRELRAVALAPFLNGDLAPWIAKAQAAVGK